MRTSSFGTIGRSLGRQLDAYAKADGAKRLTMAPKIIEMADGFFKDSFIPAEKDIMVDGLNLYAKKAAYKLVPSIDAAFKKGNGDLKSYVNALFEMSILTSKEKMMAFLEVPSEGTLTNDPMMKLSNDMITHLNTRTDELTKLQNDFGKAYRLLVDGMRLSNLSPVKYPDANSTLRLTYGKVSALPADSRNDAKINIEVT